MRPSAFPRLMLLAALLAPTIGLTALAASLPLRVRPPRPAWA